MLVKTLQFNNSYKRKPKTNYHSSRYWSGQLAEPQAYPQAYPQAHLQAQINTQSRYNSKPLEVRQQTFKGFYNFGDHLFATKTELVPTSLSKFTFSTLAELSNRQHSGYVQTVKDFIKAIREDSSFRKKINISHDWAAKISEDNLPGLPQKSILRRFAETIFSPVTELYNLRKPILKSKFGKTIAPEAHASLLKEQEQELLISKYKGFLGLNNSIKIWENSYRQFSGNPNWVDGNDFLIPKDVLLNHINSKRPLAFDPGKGQYSTKSLMLGNRVTSGLIYSIYLSTDAYNTTMKFSGDKEESSKQRKSRFMQENARIGLNLYLQNMIFSTIENSMNKSLPMALLASGSTVALSEIIGRQLVSKPIIPSDKKTLDKMEYDMAHRKGILPAIGRLMTRVKKTNHKPESLSDKMPDKASAASTANNPFSAKLPNDKISFTGFDKTAQIFDSAFLKRALDFIKEFDPKQFEYHKNIIESGIKKIGKIDGQDVSQMPLNKILETLPSIPIGDKMTVPGKIAHSVFAPIYWIKNWIKSITKIFKTIAPIVKQKEFSEFVKSNALNEEYQIFLKGRLELPVWKNSKFNLTEKHSKILEEFVNIKEKTKKEVQATKNFLLWFDKQIKANKFDLSNLTPQQRTVLENSIEKSMILSDSSKHLEYDGNTLTQLNIHLARVITTIFLVVDAYNLTMQYSNDNKKAANASAKNRFVQEATRISISAYMLGFIHNLLSKVCNSSLMGAFGVTAITAFTNDTLARLIVGVPLTPQSQEKLNKK